VAGNQGQVMQVMAQPDPKVPDGSDPDAARLAGRAWLAALPDELAAQRRVMAGLVDRCEAWPLARSLLVGCSLGRGAADALSDIDAALGIDSPGGEAGAGTVQAAEAMVVAALPELGTLVDVLRHRAGPADQYARRIFAQFADGVQLDLTVVAEAEIQARRERGGAPDFIPLYQAEPGSGKLRDQTSADGEPMAAYAVTGEQVREWAFHGWCALIDADKYLERGSVWEAHSRLHEARHHVWGLWAAAHGALYPWHGLSQVLDHDPGNLPPGIESTIAGLDAVDLRRAARATATVLTNASEAAARRHSADLPTAMAAYVTHALSLESSTSPAEDPSRRLVVLVNGLPAAGKTTLARALSRRLSLPLLSKDVIKEAHAEVLGIQSPDGRPQRARNSQFGAAASTTMWALLADSPGGAILDSTWPSRETWGFVQAGLDAAGVSAPRQIWCEVPLTLARERCAARHPTRHGIHGEPPDEHEWSGRWALATPLPIPDTLHVDTTSQVDLDAIADWCGRRWTRAQGESRLGPGD
jgi:glucokinase